MPTWVWVVIVLVVLLLVLMAVRPTGRRVTVGLDPTQLSFPPELMAQVAALIQQNEKIPAIKLLRTATPGLSLLNAKNIVDRMALRASSPGPNLNKGPGPVGAEGLPSSAPLPLDVELQVRSLVAEGKQIAAIKLVRDTTGWGLARAKAFTDAL